MTIVNVSVEAPANGPGVPAAGALRWEPSGRRIGAGGALVIPGSFTVPLVAGKAVVNVEPSTDSWVWQVTEMFVGQPVKRGYFAVPSSGPVNYTDLVPVDPVSKDPDITLADGGGPTTNFDDEELLDGGTL